MKEDGSVTRETQLQTASTTNNNDDIVRWNEQVVLDMPLCDVPRESVKTNDIFFMNTTNIIIIII